MKKISYQLLWLVGLVVLLFVVAYIFKIDPSKVFSSKPATINEMTNNASDVVVTDPNDVTYMIEGEPLTLKNGLVYFGNEVKHDFDKDGTDDTAFIVTRSTGGSGTFFYVVVTLNKAAGSVGSDGFLLGDRISPQSTNLDPTNPNIIVVNYADRRLEDSFATMPSVGKSVWLSLDTQMMKLEKVAH